MTSSPRQRAALLAIASAFLFVCGCASYHTTIENPYPEKTGLTNRFVRLRKVVYPETWYKDETQRDHADAIAGKIRANFPVDPLQDEFVLMDIEIYPENLSLESPDISTTVATQGIWPTEITKVIGESLALKFYDKEGVFLFEKRSRRMRITDEEIHSTTIFGWTPSVFSEHWYGESTYLNRRYTFLRDAVWSLADTKDVRENCEYYATKPTAAPDPRTFADSSLETLGPVGQRWAVIVGVSQYQHAGVLSLSNLRFAHRDAQSLHSQLTQSGAGLWPKENVVLLTDAAATKAAVSEAIFGFLKKAQKNDLVLVFFSGHGALDPARPKNSYFLCHDTNPEKLETTGFPVWEIANAFERGVIEARRAVILADACHSGGVTPAGAKDLLLVPGGVARGIEGLARERIRAVSSSAAGELSQENENWGGGHGAFAHAICLGLAGAADSGADKNSSGNGDGQIELNELIHYVRRTVGDLTRNAQHVQDAGGLNVLMASVPPKPQPANAK